MEARHSLDMKQNSFRSVVEGVTVNEGGGEATFTVGLTEPISSEDEEIKFTIEGTFSDSGFLANGSFNGWYSFPLNSPDTNPNLNNVGVFDAPLFDILIFDSQSNPVDRLNHTNSNAKVVLSDFNPDIPGADNYKFLTIQDTEANPNAFFEVGSLEVEYEWPYGGNPKSAPTVAPLGFKNGTFASFAATGSWESFNNPQQIDSAEINEKTNNSSFDIDGDGEYLASVDGLLFYGYLNIRNLPPLLRNNLTQQLADDLINHKNNPIRTTGEAIASYLESDLEMLDIDGNGKIEASVDGLIGYGYMNISSLPPSLRDDLTQKLADDLISDDNAIRTTGADISAFMSSYMP